MNSNDDLRTYFIRTTTHYYHPDDQHGSCKWMHCFDFRNAMMFDSGPVLIFFDESYFQHFCKIFFTPTNEQISHRLYSHHHIQWHAFPIFFERIFKWHTHFAFVPMHFLHDTSICLMTHAFRIFRTNAFLNVWSQTHIFWSKIWCWMHWKYTNPKINCFNDEFYQPVEETK